MAGAKQVERETTSVAAAEHVEAQQAPTDSWPVRSRGWIALAIVPIVLQLALTLFHLKASWDDASITTAFSRTWVQAGRIALTPGSPIVEGYSSLSWFVLLGAPYLLTSNPDAGLIWMKSCSAVFALLSLYMMYAIGLRQFRSRSSAVVAVILLACCFPTLQEIRTGMEMNLSAFLLLALFHVVTSERIEARWLPGWLPGWLLIWLLICGIGSLLILTRFEMPFTVVFLLGGLAWAALRRPAERFSLSKALLLAAVLVAVFALTELWRHRTFGQWMPNTVYAKRFAPYRDWSNLHNALATRMAATGELLHILGLPIVVTAVLVYVAALRGELSLAGLRRLHPAMYSLAFSCVCFGLVFGQNWGYDGRMIAGVVPFMILLLVGLCESAAPDWRLLRGIWGLFLGGQLSLCLVYLVHPPVSPPIAKIENVGLGADAIRMALGRPRLRIMLPDVGGSSLCCAQLDIVDAGLLTDPTLARTGWNGFAPYFRQVRPEVVETHSLWASTSHIYTDGLLADYSIVASHGIRYFVRNDLFAQLRQHDPVVPVSSAPACLQVGEDRAFSLAKGTCIVLNEPGVDNNYQ